MAGTALYSEHDPYAAEWLRNLVTAGEIASGVVDERDLWDVPPDELRQYTQVHLCAGVGLWSYALRRAGWSDDRPIWTASFPCQPFSAAGKGLGFVDERHLWPAGLHLISQCRPSVVCGEQVASKDGYAWRDLVQADLEGLGYAFWACVLPIAGVGGPGERHRQWWVAMDHPAGTRCEGRALEGAESQARDDAWLRVLDEGIGISGLADEQRQQFRGGGFGPSTKPTSRDSSPNRERERLWTDTSQRSGNIYGLADRTSERRRETGEPDPTGGQPILSSYGGAGVDGLDGAERAGLEGFAGNGDGAPRREAPAGSIAAAGLSGGLAGSNSIGCERQDEITPITGGDGPHGRVSFGNGDPHTLRPGPLNGFWRNADWLFCTDGRWRPVEPGTFPLAYGLPLGMGKISAGLERLCRAAGVDKASLKRAKAYRVGTLKCYGNAISPEPAIAFIESWEPIAP